MRKYIFSICALFFWLVTPLMAAVVDEIGPFIRSYLQELFDKEYEKAYERVDPTCGSLEALSSYWDEWTADIFSPGDIKIVSVREEEDKLIVNVTFSAANSYNARQTRRITLTLKKDGKGYRVLVPPGKKTLKEEYGGIFSPAAEERNIRNRPHRQRKYSLPEKETAVFAYPGEKKTGNNFTGDKSGGGVTPALIQQLQTSLTQLDPMLLLDLAETPVMKEILEDPTIREAISAGDYESLRTNPKLQKLVEEPAFKKIMNNIETDWLEDLFGE